MSSLPPKKNNTKNVKLTTRLLRDVRNIIKNPLTSNGVYYVHSESGKVCVSVLNTWKGEQWTSCQTIRSILMTLVTLFINNPLLNEPGFTEKHQSCKPYRNIVEYMNYKTAIHDMLSRRFLTEPFLGFFPIMKEHVKKKGKAICERLDNLAKSEINGTSASVSVYNMSIGKFDYIKVLDSMNVILASV